MYNQRVRPTPVTKVDRTLTSVIVSVRRTIPAVQIKFGDTFDSDQK